MGFHEQAVNLRFPLRLLAPRHARCDAIFLGANTDREAGYMSAMTDLVEKKDVCKKERTSPNRTLTRALHGMEAFKRNSKRSQLACGPMTNNILQPKLPLGIA